MPKVESKKLSSIAGKPVDINIYDGETLEQAEERVMQEHPEVFGGQDVGASLADEPQGNQMPDEVLKLYQAAEDFPVGSIQRTRALEQAQKMAEALGSSSKTTQEKDGKNEEMDLIGNNLAYMTEVLDQIEPGKGVLSRPMGVAQKVGYWLGQNPEVGQYESLVNGLASPVARTLFAEKGALAEGDVKRAQSLFPSIYTTKEDRDFKINNIIKLLNNATGKDWTSKFKKSSSMPNVDMSAVDKLLKERGLQ